MGCVGALPAKSAAAFDFSSADETDVLDDGIVQDERLEPQIPYAGVSMEDGLRNWAFETNQTQRSVTLLLRHLRQFPPYNNLPSDARTLLKPLASTSQDEKEISSIAGGQFWYKVSKNALNPIFRVKAFNAVEGCQKCTILTEYDARTRWRFFRYGAIAQPRTDKKFREEKYREH
uniref:Uncharacterized protein n=1 Tax=Anopheles merus TaxID=30066 RepID=A0A182V9N4_ANOME